MSFDSDGTLRPRDILGEAVRIAIADPVPSILSGAVVAAVTLTVILTAGLGVEAERAVLARIDDLGTRLVVIGDPTGGASVPSESIERVRRLSTVQWAFGLGFTRDARNAVVPDGPPIPTREAYGPFPPVIRLQGRQPRPGEVILGEDAPGGFLYSGGGLLLDGKDYPVVGRYAADGELGFLGSGALLIPDGPGTLRSLYVLARTPESVGFLAPAVLEIVGAEQPAALTVTTSKTLADLRFVVAGELGRAQRVQTIQALSIALLIVVAVVYGSVSLHRRDYGRRRALGASRGTILTLIVMRYLVVALAAMLLTDLVGVWIVRGLTGEFPDSDLIVSVSILVLMTTAVATLPPALIAASQDPVRVLRVP